MDAKLMPKDTRPHFNNDYNHGMHPRILELFNETNGQGFDGYGTDEWCERARVEIHKYIKCDSADIHFITGGTLINIIMIETMLTRPYYSVIAPESGHINAHESGAIEHIGHRIEALPHKNGKISAKQIDDLMHAYELSPLKDHITQPKGVYITFPTEFGTVYTKKELTDIREVCDRYGLYLCLDGARFGYGLASSATELTIEDITQLADIYTIGGTKCGMLFGEALIIRNDDLKVGIRNLVKQSGGLFAKGWALGLQFYALFEEGTYFEICKSAVEKAKALDEYLVSKGFVPFIESDSNQLFYSVDKEKTEKLKKLINIEAMDPIDEDHILVRFCVSWSTSDEDIEALKEAVESL